jgi:hypothetical protein
MRRGLTWALAVPLMLAGSQAAHALAYAWVYPEAHARVLMLAATGHGYLSWLPLVLALAGAAAVVALAATAVDTARGRAARALPAAGFALLPPLAFALQELLELSLHTGTFAWHAFVAPTFLPGLLLQLPFALVAYLVARLLLRAAREVGRALAPARPPRTLVFVSPSTPRAAAPLPRPRVAGTRLAKRGPPLAAGA